MIKASESAVWDADDWKPRKGPRRLKAVKIRKAARPRKVRHNVGFPGDW